LQFIILEKWQLNNIGWYGFVLYLYDLESKYVTDGILILFFILIIHRGIDFTKSAGYVFTS